jgi:hypothetical protein
VQVINLPLGSLSYGDVLTETFEELAAFWRARVIPESQVKEELPLRELSLPPGAATRLCFFAVPLSLLSFYRERVFPVVERNGFVPVSADDVVSPGHTVQAKVEALIQRALLVVVDVSSAYTEIELALVIREKEDPSRVLIIRQADSEVPFDVRKVLVLVRPDVTNAESEHFLTRLEEWLMQAANQYKPTLREEPMRLLEAGEYRAAVIAAISQLEASLRERLELPSSVSGGKTTPLRAILEDASRQGLLGNISVQTLLGWLRTRNAIVHGGASVSKATAGDIVLGVSHFMNLR